MDVKSKILPNVDSHKKEKIVKRLVEISLKSNYELFSLYNSSINGIENEEVIAENAEKYGRNIITKAKKTSLFKRLFLALINPFTAILFVLATISFFTDIVLVKTTEKDFATVLIIVAMIILSGLVRFIQETKSDNAAEKLQEMVETTTSVIRNGVKKEIPLDEIVVGDIIDLSAGDIIPSDVVVLQAKDFFVSQSSLTGESEAVEKLPYLVRNKKYDAITDRTNLCFMGTTVISGSARAMVIVTGNETLFGQVAISLNEKNEKTSFEIGVNKVSWILIRFMLMMVPIVFILNGLTKDSWLDALLFAISIAVGLTPQMLPMIVTTCLAKGAVGMSKQKTIIKDLNSIQNFGAIDVLCTDKTGTITQDKIILEYHLDVHGNDEPRVLRHAFLNSYYQTGLKNLLDISIIEKTQELATKVESLKNISTSYVKVDEVPFDFSRRRMSVVVKDNNGKTQMITKGAVEEILSVCRFVEYKGVVLDLSNELKAEVRSMVTKLNEKGMRVIAVAQKTNPSPVGSFSVKDESDMVLIGYLAFYDPPKESARDAIKAFADYGVKVKILTGDNDQVTSAICKQVGLKIEQILLGNDVEKMSDRELSIAVEQTNVFAKLSPDQKARVIKILKGNHHVVGYMGDGINDAAALKASDVGISVDTAVDIAKEAANIILLEKDLNVLEKGIIEGRKTYVNMVKYIKMTASSNFGNMLSVLLASAFLPFLPMLPVHLLLLNLIYDISCTAIPWDNVDKEYLTHPKKFSGDNITKFMMWFGPISSIFDILTFVIMFFVICPLVLGGNYSSLDSNQQIQFMMLFQAGWFIESMWSQTLIIHMIRTPKIPFIQSRASKMVSLITFAGIIIATLIPYTIGSNLDFIAPPLVYFIYLALVLILYVLLASLIKKLYVKKYGELL